MSAPARTALAAGVAEALQGAAHRFVGPGEDCDIAFVSRDVTGLSTKYSVMPETQHFYDGLLNATSLRWVQIHSAGVDRPVYLELRRRGLRLTSSSGANTSVVVQSALAGLLALARHFPQLMAAQRRKAWEPLLGARMPRDLAGQTALIVGWGLIGQGLAGLLRALGLRIVAVRSSALNAAPAEATVAFEQIGDLLPRADWLVLACPLTERTRGLIDAAALARLPPGARLINVARGEVVDEAALIEALRSGRLVGAFLDVFAQEPLPADSPLWELPGVLLTPHSAGHSDGNEARVGAIFLDNLARWQQGRPLLNEVD